MFHYEVDQKWCHNNQDEALQKTCDGSQWCLDRTLFTLRITQIPSFAFANFSLIWWLKFSCLSGYMVLRAIFVCHWSFLKLDSWVINFRRFTWKNNFLCLLSYIWVKQNFLFVCPFRNFIEIVIQHSIR